MGLCVDWFRMVYSPTRSSDLFLILGCMIRWPPTSCTLAFPLCIPVLYGLLIPSSFFKLNKTALSNKVLCFVLCKVDVEVLMKILSHYKPTYTSFHLILWSKTFPTKVKPSKMLSKKMGQEKQKKRVQINSPFFCSQKWLNVSFHISCRHNLHTFVTLLFHPALACCLLVGFGRRAVSLKQIQN